MLLKRLDELMESNEHYVKDYEKHALLENENVRLRERVKTLRKLSRGIDHLWAIKEM